MVWFCKYLCVQVCFDPVFFANLDVDKFGLAKLSLIKYKFGQLQPIVNKSDLF